MFERRRRQAWVRRSETLYGWLLHLYPRGFREAYGGAMRDCFARWIGDEVAVTGGSGIWRVWRTTIVELLPTVLREHGRAWAEVVSPAMLPRLLVAGLLPVLACAVAVRWLGVGGGDAVLVAGWFALIAAAMARVGGRGWACSRDATVVAAASIGVPLLYAALTTVATPSLFVVGPLIVAAAAGVGLILSTGVRLVIEGVTFATPSAMPITVGRLAPGRSRGFSLVELLVVIGIIAILLGILLPVLASVRRTARETACLANVHDLGRSFQLYTDANRGKSFLMPGDVTSPAWFELLAPYSADLPRMLICPEATEAGNMIGSATKAWGPLRTYDAPAPQWTVRGTFVGSYGFNGWLWRLPPGQAMPDEVRGFYVELPAAVRASATPILADCISAEGTPRDTDTVPTNLQQPLPTSESHLPGPRGFMAYYCIDRHRRAVNVVFLDGHAARTGLAELWTLQWHRGFVGRGVGVP